MNDLLRYLIEGVPIGCVYALVAVGLVLTYKTSGVFNLAFGAQAFLSAIIYINLREYEGWSIVPAFLLAVVVVAPLGGFLLDRCLFRFLRGTTWQVKLITALGLLAGLPQIIQLMFGQNAEVNPPGLAPDPDWKLHIGTNIMQANEVIAIGVTLLVVVLLGLVFRFTALGLQMRAVVESPRMVELAGVNSERVGVISWMLAGIMAGLAGVLLAPLYATVDANSFTTLLVVAITAAAFGRLISLPLTLLGGLLLGVGQQALAGTINPTSVIAQGLRPSLPFVVLFLLLLLWVGNRREVTDPLKGVDPPAPNLAVSYHDARLRRINQIVFPAFLVALFVSVFTWIPDLWVFRITSGLVIAVILLSITVITGMSGQVSAMQATFAGIGGFTAAQLASEWGTSIPVTMLVGAVVAGLIGAGVALVSLRLGGIYLTLLTLAAALAADAVLFQWSWFTGGTSGVASPRPVLLGFDLNDDTSYFVFTFLVFAVVALVVILLRKGTTGRYLAALRGSEVAAPSIGINPVRARITVFTISAAIAGLGGGLYAMLNGQLYPGDNQFSAFYGLIFVVLVVTLGARTVDGAVNAGLGFVLFQSLLDELGFGDNALAITVIGFAFGAITYARHPEGIVELQKLRSIRGNLHNRALAARAAALRSEGGLARPLHPPAILAVTALPAALYYAALLATGHEVGTTEVLVLGLALAVPMAAVTLTAHRWLVRTRGRGPRGVLGVLLYGSPLALFLLPAELARLARERDRPLGLPIDWTVGNVPGAAIVFNVIVQSRRGGSNPLDLFSDSPSTLAWGIVLAVGVIVLLNWLSRVLWAVADLQVSEAESGRPDQAQLPVPSAPASVLAPAGGPGPGSG